MRTAAAGSTSDHPGRSSKSTPAPRTAPVITRSLATWRITLFRLRSRARAGIRTSEVRLTDRSASICLGVDCAIGALGAGCVIGALGDCAIAAVLISAAIAAAEAESDHHGELRSPVRN